MREKILIRDFNVHVGVEREGVEAMVDAFGIGNRNDEGERFLDFVVRNGLSIMNTFYKVDLEQVKQRCGGIYG